MILASLKHKFSKACRNYFCVLLLLFCYEVQGKTTSPGTTRNMPESPSFEFLFQTTTPLTCESLLQAINTKTVADDWTKQIANRLQQIIAAKTPNQTQKKEEVRLIKLLHAVSHCYLEKIQPDAIDKRINWEQLTEFFGTSLTVDANRIEPLLHSLMTIWIDYLKESNQRLGQYFKIPHHIAGRENQESRYIKIQGAFLAPDQGSMWLHCQKYFAKRSKGWSAVLRSGFLSPAFQFVQFTKTNIDIETALNLFPIPGYGDYQQPYPAISIELDSKSNEYQDPPWDLLYETCQDFGFQVIYPEDPHLRGELRFVGFDALYRDIFLNPLLPENLATDLPAALHASGFYPSPQGLRTILALGAQESTLQWNPKLNSQKKEMLRNRFDSILSKIMESVPSSVSSFFLSKEHKAQLERLIKELHKITDPKQDKSREYDFYRWSRETYAFIQDMVEHHSQMAMVGVWFFDLQSLMSRLEKEPQTFGLWQINVNHLQEKIDSYKQIRRAFPEIYQNINDSWTVNRSWLIEALSGRPNARLDKRRTLELLIHVHLRPHYENHLLGDDDDLMYFIAENMAGEMSTFRAAIQKELNKKMRSDLVTDGDLSFYLPYSTQIDWSKQSKTYTTLQAFIEAHRYYFKEPVQPEKLLESLCLSRSWEELNQLELYQKLMDKNSPVRIYPEIKSNLYNQTPKKYTQQVVKKSHLF